ncbi:endonuclease NucS domain-containing protein [Roseibaca calidilacus]|nr:endonuclease NucS domain-containing protein [Roseibaca calidilacus]
MIRDEHPRQNARWPNPRGVVYLAFSPGSGGQWSLAVDTFRAGRGDYGHAVFNGKYHEQFAAAELPFVFEGRNKTAGHLVVTRQHVISTLEALSGFDHSVLALNRNAHDGVGFTTEYVIQREILTNWDQTPWSARYDVVQDEFPVDGGLTSRRIDILARDRMTGDWLIFELKRAEAKPAAVRQVADYLLALGKQDKFAHGRLNGVLVAERIPPTVRTLAKAEGVAVYEVSWPLNLIRAA